MAVATKGKNTAGARTIGSGPNSRTMRRSAETQGNPTAKASTTRGRTTAGSKARPNVSTMVGLAIEAFLPDLRKQKASELTVPETYLAGKALAYRQRMLRSARLELAGKFEDSETRAGVVDLVRRRIRHLERTRQIGEDNSAIRFAWGVRECWSEIAIELSSQ